MCRARTTVRALVVVLAVLASGAGWMSAAAAPAGESIPSFDARIDVDSRGDLHVTETIEYDFAGGERHGVQRELRTRFVQPGARDRTYPVTEVAASSPSGAPADVAMSQEGGFTVLRIGDPQQTVHGRQTYVLRYAVRGAFNRIRTSIPLRDDEGGAALPPHDELYWNVTGSEWDVPIGRATVAITAPQPASALRCYRGVPGSSDPCVGVAGTTSTFSTGALPPGQGLTVALAYPTGMVGVPGPLSVDASPPPAPPAPVGPSTGGQIFGFVLMLAVAGGLYALVHVLRHQAEKSVAAVAPAEGSRPTRRALSHPVPDPPPMPAEPLTSADGPIPPRDLRPGQLGVLLERRAETTAVTATLVDLAVRGFLRIEEVPGSRGRRPADWKLVMVQPPPEERLLPYEETLLEAVFAGGSTVRVQERRNTFARHLAQVKDELFRDAVYRGWFAEGGLASRAGDAAGTLGQGVAVAIAVVVVLTFVVFSPSFASFHLGFVLIAGAGVVGLLVAAFCRRRRTRSAAGDAVLAGTGGFRAELAARTADRVRADRASEVFSRSLPYAMVLGLAEHWSRQFDELSRSRSAMHSPWWYVGAASTMDFLQFSGDLTAFAATTSGALSSTPGSSGSSGFSSSGSSGSSGFSSGSDYSGGGGGGGGGSSW
jgi:Predicted membrane protein (DUF2207) C-terminal domain/Predicted membrane protein (DUF2207) N-terminal domain